MFAKVKSSIFIDTVHLQLSMPGGHHLRGVLKDEKGLICRTLEKEIRAESEVLDWTGLNDLPYGRYTLELSQQENEPGTSPVKLSLVKRV